jgi:hypothetical protein
MTHHHDSHDDLQAVIEQLRAHRPEASPLELDAVKQRVRGRVARHTGRRARSANLMKSRLAILTTLALGMVFSTAGAGLAISGFASGSDDASVAQYGPGPGAVDDRGAVLPEQDESAPRDDVAGERGERPSGEDLQPTRQAEAGVQGGGGDELPFTGFAAIPILIGGVALLSTGMILRRRTDDRA